MVYIKTYIIDHFYYLYLVLLTVVARNTRMPYLHACRNNPPSPKKKAPPARYLKLLDFLRPTLDAPHQAFFAGVLSEEVHLLRLRLGRSLLQGGRRLRGFRGRHLWLVQSERSDVMVGT